MPVPWEALIPFGARYIIPLARRQETRRLTSASHFFLLGLLTSMFAAAGTLLNTSKMAQNQGKVRIFIVSIPLHTRH